MKTLKFASALLFALIIGFGFTSCSDDEFEFNNYVVGSWEAEYVSITNNMPSGTIRSVYTFKSDGTGYVISKDNGTLEETFKYEVFSFDEKSGSNIDFVLYYKVLNDDGTVKYTVKYGGKKVGKKTWNLSDEFGIQTYYVMHKK